jgi:hypothetical protein
MPGTWITRQQLVFGYLFLTYVLIALVLGAYVALDILGVHQVVMGALAQTLFESGHDLRYASRSRE